MNENNELVNYKSYDQEDRRDKNDSVNISRQGGVRKPNQRVKPKFFKLLGQIMNLHVEVIYFVKTKPCRTY